ARDAKALAEEERLLKEINDPKLLEALAKDPLLAKRLLNHRDKSLQDMRNIASSKPKLVQPKQRLEDIISEAHLRKEQENSSDSSDSDGEWEAMARKEEIRKKMVAKTKSKKKFKFDPGFSDEE
ncbi:hypothetical protein GGH17_003381, partial [Coemansia sp. RSA 788]